MQLKCLFLKFEFISLCLVIEVYHYPPLHVDPKLLVGNWTMLQLFPSPLNPFCNRIIEESDCRANDECAWCNEGQCLYKMESKRPGNKCSVGAIPTDTNDVPGRLRESQFKTSVALN